MKPEVLIREYITNAQTRMMQLATTSNGQPWICTVYYAVDDNLDIYWISMPSRRHSQEIAKNSKVAVAFAYNQQPPLPYVRGVQVEGEATLLSGDEAKHGADLYAKQLNSDAKWIAAVLDGSDPHRIYRMKPTSFVLFDSQNFPDNSRQEWNLS